MSGKRGKNLTGRMELWLMSVTKQEVGLWEQH